MGMTIVERKKANDARILAAKKKKAAARPMVTPVKKAVKKKAVKRPAARPVPKAPVKRPKTPKWMLEPVKTKKAVKKKAVASPVRQLTPREKQIKKALEGKKNKK